MSRCNPSLRATDSESRQLVYSAKRDPKVEAVAANADRLTICTRRYKAEWSEVCCFPQGHNASALVCDHDALPLEGRLKGAAQSISRECRQDDPSRRTHHRHRARV